MEMKLNEATHELEPLKVVTGPVEVISRIEKNNIHLFNVEMLVLEKKKK